jgi:KaiC/GvpD/RAD55 family RecA-like ATPase
LNTTGVEALDGRIGALKPGGIYCFFGASSAGKSVLGLHFLIEGLEQGEHCVLVTRDEPVMMDGRALYLGYTPRRVSDHERLHVVRLPPRLPNDLALPPGAALRHLLAERIGGVRPTRIVFDSVDALADYSERPASLLGDLVGFLQTTGATIYVLARADRDANIDAAEFAPLLAAAAGAFRLQVMDRGERRFLFHTVPDGSFRAEPFAYSLRSGAGFSEELTLDTAPLDPADRRRVIVLDEQGVLPPEAVAALRELFDLEVLDSMGGALGLLSAGRYGALVLAVDPFDEARAFDLAFALRKDGNAAPIVFAAPSSGLRSTTRSRGLRIGGDDFFVTDLPPAEIVDRIQVAWSRGAHRREGVSHIGQIVQPVDGEGQPRPMLEAEFTEAMDTLLSQHPPLFFCYVEFALRDSMPEVVWPALRTRVRIGDGDIIGQLPNRRFACVLDRITLEQTRRVLDRIRSAHPALQTIRDIEIISSPMRAEEIRARLALAGAGAVEAAAG